MKRAAERPRETAAASGGERAVRSGPSEDMECALDRQVSAATDVARFLARVGTRTSRYSADARRGTAALPRRDRLGLTRGVAVGINRAGRSSGRSATRTDAQRRSNLRNRRSRRQFTDMKSLQTRLGRGQSRVDLSQERARDRRRISVKRSAAARRVTSRSRSDSRSRGRTPR